MGVTTTTNTTKQLTNNYDLSQIFLWEPIYATADLTNSTGGDLTYPAGTLLGRVAIGQEVAVLKSASVDGSEIPVAILAEDITIPDTVTLEVPICVGGKVAEEKVIFDGADDFDTIVDGRSLRDRIASDTIGIELVTATENTDFDN